MNIVLIIMLYCVFSIEALEDAAAQPKIEYLLKIVSKEKQDNTLAKMLSQHSDKKIEKRIGKLIENPKKLNQVTTLKDYWPKKN